MAYQLEGKLLEVCNCKVLCPCWVGEDPDFGHCDAALAWHVEQGTVNGTDVSGRTLALLNHIPGNILKGNWRVRMYVDDRATPAQKNALVDVWSGKLGGPVADLAKLVGEVMSVDQVPITFDVEGAKGTLRVGSVITAELEPFQGATGKATALHDTVFTTIPGSPAFVGKASRYQVNAPELRLDLRDHNAISGSFRFQG
jgi:hypothetical protein